MATRPPTARMRRLGVVMRKLREERGLSLDQAAKLVDMSRSTLSRMENAQVISRRRDVAWILMKYGINTDEPFAAALLDLTSGGRSGEWIKRHAASGQEPIVRDFVLLEQDSGAIRTHAPTLIPGLLQTPAYARAVMESVPQLPGVDIDQAVAFRMARKEALSRPDPVKLDAVMGEAAIRQMLGGTEVMRDQLLYVAQAMEQQNITLQILPFSATRNPGVDGAFTILDVEVGDFTLVITDSLDSIRMDEERIGPYGTVFRSLQALAWSPSESRLRIRQAAEEIHGLPESPGGLA